MAQAFRMPGSDKVFIRAEMGFAPDPGHVFAMVIGGTSFPLPGARRLGDVIELDDERFVFEQMLLRVGLAQPLLLAWDAREAAVLLSEALHFHPSFSAPFFDFARNPRMPPFAMETYARPGRLAVFTHVHDDSDGLRLWERHYARLVPHRCLYVVDHGSSRPPQEVLDPRTQVVSIPRGEVDHLNIGQFCAYFQRFLLCQFAWVIHVDCDELLVHEQGVEAFLARLDDPAYGPIVKAGRAAELLDHTGGAEPLDPCAPVSLQRHVLNGAPYYLKPVLAREPTSWGVGFHHAMEDTQVTADDELWLLHLRYADLSMAARREGIWTDAPQSRSAQAFTPQDHRRHTLAGLQEKIDDTMSEDRFEMPAWMRGTF